MMKRRNYGDDLKEVFGNLDDVLPKLVNEMGQQRTASHLNVSQAWVSEWLRRHGYKKMTRWEKQEPKDNK